MDNIFLEVLEKRPSQKHQSIFPLFRFLSRSRNRLIYFNATLLNFSLHIFMSCAKSVPKMTLRLTELYENESENSSESLISGCIFGKEVYAVLF